MLRASAKVAAMPGDDSDDALRPAAGAPGSRPSITSTRASRTTATGTGCSAGSTSPTSGWRHAGHLIAAEDLADRASRAASARGAGPDGGSLIDLDLDGIDEVRLAGPGQVLGIKLDAGAGIGSWDIRPVRHALAAVLRRRPEAYHRTLIETPDGGPFAPGAGATSIHDVVRSKESGLAERIHYDTHERRSGLVRFLASETQPAAYAAADETELGDFVEGAFELVELTSRRLVSRRLGSVRSIASGARQPVLVEKRLVIGGTRRRPSLSLEVQVEHLGHDPIDSRFGIEWSLILLGGGANPAAYHEVEGRRYAHDGSGTAAEVASVAAGNDTIGIRLDTTIEPAAEAWWAPIETISNSEGGFERIYQGSGQLFSWPIRLDPGEQLAVRVSQGIVTDRDWLLEDRLRRLIPASPEASLGPRASRA